MKHSKEMLLVKVADLVVSPYNVRRHSSGEVEELAALIDSQTLLQNLIVHEQAVGRGQHRKTRFGVVAGGRRRRALALLVQRGKLPQDHEVLCELVSIERALEISLAENSGREPIHPADEFEAFQALVQAGKGIEDVAARFGVSPLTVQRRLKLAALSPKLLALYREDGINLDQLMALCLSNDHAAQERVWFEAQPWDRNPAALRRALTEGEVQASENALARFVGIAAYEAAGGVVRRDLFDDEQAGWICDPDLLRRLASEKLDAAGEAVRGEGWAWMEVRLEADARGQAEFTRCEPVLRKASAEEARSLAELDKRSEELDAESQAMDDADTWTPADVERIELEQQDIAQRQRVIQCARQVWREADKAHAGAIVTIGRDGEVHVLRGLMRPEDRRAARKTSAAAETAGARAEGETRTSGERDAVESGEATYSEVLLRRLAAHKTAALQAVLAQQPATALVVLTHGLAVQVFERYGLDARSALQLSARPPRHDLLKAADDLPASRAWTELERLRLVWAERLPQDEGDWLAWIAELPQADLLDLLALCAAVTLHWPAGGSGPAKAVERLTAIDMTQWWQPTAEGFLKHVPKSLIAQAMNDAGVGAPGNSAAMKKAELAALAEGQLGGKGWLPEPLRPALCP